MTEPATEATAEEVSLGSVATPPRVVKSWPEVRFYLVDDLEQARSLNTAGQHEEVNAVLSRALTLLRTVFLRPPTPYPGISPSIIESDHVSDVASEASYHSDTLPPPPPWDYQFRDYEPGTSTSMNGDGFGGSWGPYSPRSPDYELTEDAHLRPMSPDYELTEDADSSDPESEVESNTRCDIEE